MANVKTFAAKAPILMRALMSAFPKWGVLDAAAAAGNGGAESGGFTKFQELKPTVKGSRGGYGWFQWTGPRRKAFEAWCAKNSFAPDSDQANIQYLIVELKGPEKATIAAVAKAKTLADKVVAFERSFERAGIPHHDSRIRWAERALAAWQSAGGKAPTKPKPTAAIVDPAIVKPAQAVLNTLNYNAGGADGIIGPLTRGAILAFRADHGLPLVPYIDQAFLDALDKATPRAMVPERANATPAEVATVVPEANAHWRVRAGSLVTGAAATAAGAVDYAAPARGFVDQLRDYAADVPGYVWIGSVVVLCVVLYYVANHGLNKATEAFQSGERR